MDFIVDTLAAGELTDYVPHLRRELMQEGGLILLDGLDEVPEAENRRAQIKQVVEDFADTFHRCRVLVTSRTYAYQKQDWRLPDFADTVLAPFSEGQIRRFVDRWYAHMGDADARSMQSEDAQGRAEVLKTAIFRSSRLRGLAERPLLLTLMASLHAWRGGSLPERREELYADAVDLLLDWWESQRVVRDAAGTVELIQPSLAEWLKVDRAKVRELLNELAYKAHKTQPELVGTADVPEEGIITGLMRLSQNPDVRPQRLVEYLSHRAGLLVPRGVGVYTFPHRTFQEYLAACHLTGPDYPDELAKLAREDPNRWREVALLAGAKAARGVASAIWQLVEALCYRDPDAPDANEADTWGARLAGQALMESADLDEVSERHRPKVARVRDWQVHIMRKSDLGAVERAGAGDVLAVLGDPRPEVVTVNDMQFRRVPAGTFTMGSDKSMSRERPQHQLEIPYDYWISMYPVTTAQFRAFSADGGYRERNYWTEAGWEWRQSESVEAFREPPEPWNHVNRPVVGVTWYEALAFCAWLTERLRSAASADDGEMYRALTADEYRCTLPSEAEWEKAARGTDAHEYPWGSEVDPERANYDETGVGTTSAVGCFAKSVSPYGVEEMSGNVWEWTRSLWGEDLFEPEYTYPYDAEDGREDLDASADSPRVLRGGAFTYSAYSVRCAYRYRFGPDVHYRGGGFRVAVSPAV